MIGSIILGVVVFLLLVKLLKWFKKEKEEALKTAAVFGIGVAIVNYAAIKLPAVLAVLLVFVAIFGMVYLFQFWKEEGDTLKEAALFLLINLVVAIVLNNAACRMHDLTSVKWVTATFDSISTMAFIVVIGCLIANVIKFRMELNGDFEGKGDKNDDDEEGFWKRFAAQFWY